MESACFGNYQQISDRVGKAIPQQRLVSWFTFGSEQVTSFN